MRWIPMLRRCNPAPDRGAIATEMARDLDKIIAKAETAHVSPHAIVDVLESRAAAVRVRQAATAPMHRSFHRT